MKKSHSITICQLTGLVLLTITFTSAMADNMYKWVDEQGKVTYQSSPPPGNAVSVERSRIKAPSDVVEANLPEGDSNKNVIKFYVKEKCESCEDARSFLSENALPFEEINLTDDVDEAEKLEKQLGVIDVPIFSIGEKFVSGFQQDMLNKILRNDGYKLFTENDDVH